MGNLIEPPELKIPSVNPGEIAELRDLEVTVDDMTFVSQYVTTRDQGAAYATVYNCDPVAARRLGTLHLGRPRIQKALSFFYKKIGEALLLDSSVIYAKVWEIANDPSAKHGDRLRALDMLDRMVKEAEKGAKNEETIGPVVNVLINAVGGDVKAEVKPGDSAKPVEIFDAETISVGPSVSSSED